MGGLIHLIVYLFKLFRIRLAGLSTRGWPAADAIVTEDSLQVRGSFGSTIEIVYSYRVEGELYTGMHEEPCFLGSHSDYINRFTKGRNFVVRVKPGEPELSVMRDSDQGDRLG